MLLSYRSVLCARSDETFAMSSLGTALVRPQVGKIARTVVCRLPPSQTRPVAMANQAAEVRPLRTSRVFRDEAVSHYDTVA